MYEITPRTMFMQRAERNISLVGWGEGSHSLLGSWDHGSWDPTNWPDIYFRSLHSHVLDLSLKLMLFVTFPDVSTSDKY